MKANEVKVGDVITGGTHYPHPVRVVEIVGEETDPMAVVECLDGGFCAVMVFLADPVPVPINPNFVIERDGKQIHPDPSR